jgi:molybdopterin-containing oxidoreductase family iron-sulfur binding subunit
MLKPLDRRNALKQMAAGSLVGSSLLQGSCKGSGDDESFETMALNWEEYFKKNYRLMTAKEKKETIQRLEKLHSIRNNHTSQVQISDQGPIPGVLYGYAFNLSKCKGYMDCVSACVEENNQDRASNMQYIRIFEMKNGRISLDHADGNYQHKVPLAGHFYLGTQCFQCENPPCVDVCPVGATWKEKDGIIVIDYDWCIGCRYCQAACPYWARRFNWQEPEVPDEELNPDQHYLGNRQRKKGVMEKCTFCIQRSRKGQNPACVEACPTGARVFGNLLDPASDIRYVIENKKVFRLKEELKTEPKFWYFMD